MASPHRFASTPRYLAVTVPDVGPEVKHCMGQYVLVDDLVVNGEPVWRRFGTGPPRCLYASDTGSWYFSEDAERTGFKGASGCIKCEAIPGRLPHEVCFFRGWHWTDGEEWFLEVDIHVDEVGPEAVIAQKLKTELSIFASQRLVVAVPRGADDVKTCAGLYSICLDRWSSGQMVWEKVQSDWWGVSPRFLYMGLNGRWFIGGEDAARRDFKCSSGWIAAMAMPGGAPHEVQAGSWQVWNGEQWMEDESITVMCSFPMQHFAAANEHVDALAAEAKKERDSAAELGRKLALSERRAAELQRELGIAVDEVSKLHQSADLPSSRQSLQAVSRLLPGNLASRVSSRGSRYSERSTCASPSRRVDGHVALRNSSRNSSTSSYSPTRLAAASRTKGLDSCVEFPQSDPGSPDNVQHTGDKLSDDAHLTTESSSNLGGPPSNSKFSVAIGSI